MLNDPPHQAARRTNAVLPLSWRMTGPMNWVVVTVLVGISLWAVSWGWI
jgi:hypothetical protein